MPSSQFFIYNTDDGGLNTKTQRFTLAVNEQRVIRAAGLQEDVQIYQMVGVCAECRPEDVLWSPVYKCGQPLMLGLEVNNIWLSLPGTYSVGDPTTPFTLTGDVNITSEKYRGVDTSLLGKCCESSSQSEVVGIEATMAELGCVADANGLIIGKVMLCKIIDEETGAETISMTAYLEDGTIIQNYTGPWQICSTSDVCQSEPSIGVITDLSILAN